MSTPLLHPDALLALLSAEFTPTKKPAAKPQPAQVAKEAYTPATREQYLLSNPQHWVPVAVIHHVLEQTCQCCHETTEILGSTLIRHSNPRLMAFWECQRTTLQTVAGLPREYVYHKETVEECPTCLRAEAYLCDWPASREHQLKLFH